MDKAGIKHDPRNARKHSSRNTALIENSIQRDGFGRSILLANDGTVIAGNATIDAASSAGFDDVMVIETDGTKVIAVKRTDVAPGSKEFHNLAIADNRAAELADWDGPAIAALAGDGLLDPSLFWSDDEFGQVMTGLAGSDNEYTKDTPSPIYSPTGERPDVATLMDSSVRNRLIEGIASAELPDDVRAFLDAAASRHIVFNYRRIAEFYAHADIVTQRLMEDSALIIIDFDRATELGYVRLSSRLSDILAEALDDD